MPKIKLESLRKLFRNENQIPLMNKMTFLTIFFAIVTANFCLATSNANVFRNGTTYYVDAATGDDSNPGTFDEPFKTYLPFVWTYDEPNPDIGKIQLQAGDEVFFRKGFYSATFQTPSDLGNNQYRGLFLRNVHGTSSQPIVIRGEPGAVIDAMPPVECNLHPDFNSECASFRIFDCSNFEIYGLEFSGLGRAIRVSSSSNFSIHTNWIHDIDGEDNGNMEPLHFVGNSGNVEIFDNLLHDNFDRTNADTNGEKTENSRHMGFYSNHGAAVRVHHNLVFNSIPITSQFTGAGIVNKHGGDGSFEVDRNVIMQAWNTAIGTNNPNSFVHRNLVVASDGFSVRDFGGPSYFNDITIAFNTLSDCDGGLLYRPNNCLLYTSPSPRDQRGSRMPSSA